jgi:hypothetical protein
MADPDAPPERKRPLLVRIRLFLVHLVEQLVGVLLRQP